MLARRYQATAIILLLLIIDASSGTISLIVLWQPVIGVRFAWKGLGRRRPSQLRVTRDIKYLDLPAGTPLHIQRQQTYSLQIFHQ